MNNFQFALEYLQDGFRRNHAGDCINAIADAELYARGPEQVKQLLEAAKPVAEWLRKTHGIVLHDYEVSGEGSE